MQSIAYKSVVDRLIYIASSARTFIVCATVAVLLLAGCSSSAAPAAQQSAAPATRAATVQTAFTLTGSITAKPQDSYHPACEAYSLEHVPVVVRDEHGTILASTQTGANVQPVPTPYSTAGPNEYGVYGKAKLADIDAYLTAAQTCLTTFTATVPRAAFYQLRIGTHDGQPYSFDQLQAAGWTLALSLN